MVLQSDLEKLIDAEENYPTVKNETLIDKYRIPVHHFEFSYIETCTDGRELEKIVQVLRSGEEGHFPDLTKFAESRLAVVKPKSKLLRKACPVLSKEHLSKDEKNEITNDITEWILNVSQHDEELAFFKNRKTERNVLPEIRKANETILKENKAKTKRISSTDYSSWDKYDPDTEILKMDLEEENLKKTVLDREKKKSTKKSVHFKEFTTDVEALHAANYEKDKGNEFYKAGDFKEALKHYTNSINCKPTLAGFNNRALVNIKLKKYKNAIGDCHSALSIDPSNTKSLLRKAQALDGLGKHVEALESVEEAIQNDPNNSHAQELAEKFRNLCSTVSKTRRFVVQDVVKEVKNKKNVRESKKEVIIPIPGTSKMSPPHYITCSDSNVAKIKEFTVRANTPNQIVHLVSVDTSDVEDDDSCTVNHLENICSGSAKNDTHKEVRVRDNDTDKDALRKNDTKHQENTVKTMKAIKQTVFKHSESEYCPTINQYKTQHLDQRIDGKTRNQQHAITNDRHAGGEPYVKDSENVEMPEDIHSPYNFLKAWNSANIDKTLEQHATILRNIDMNRIVGVIGCKLDNTMFSTIIKCLCVHFAVPGEVERLYTILQTIVNLPRFDIIVMLMSAEDRNHVNTLVNFLKQHGKPLSQHVLNKFFNNSYLISHEGPTQPAAHIHLP